jgi:formylglycine-generating enzyme required for sulfatase activity
VPIPGATLRFGIDSDTARWLYQQCQQDPAARCGTDFERSVFARSVAPAAPQTVKAFAIDSVEVSNLRFAQFLDAQASTLRLDAWPSPGVLVLDADGRPWAAAAADAQDVTPYGIQRVDLHYAPVPGRAQRAVSYVSQYAAWAFCRAQGQRLPTELEWELAARGAEGRAYPWGNQAPDCHGVTFNGEASTCLPPHAPADVGQSALDRTALGVHDLAGNVLEWTASRFDARAAADRERCGDTGCAIVRGASYLDRSVFLHAVLRGRLKLNEVVDSVGFRCAKDLP